MAVIPYPSIDAGFIYDPGKKLDYIMSDFYETEFSQSYLFKGALTSLPYILQQNPNNQDGAINAVRTALTTIFLKYFDDCEVSTAAEDTTSATSYNIRLYVKVTQEGQSVELFNLLKTSGGKLMESLKVRQ